MLRSTDAASFRVPQPVDVISFGRSSYGRDGVTSVPEGLEDVSCYPRLTEELLRRGYSESDIHKILGGNALRVLKQAEIVARLTQARLLFMAKDAGIQGEGYVIPEVGRLLEFLEFLELRDRYGSF